MLEFANMKMDKTSKSKHPEVYAFIDSQNLNLGTSKDILRVRNKSTEVGNWTTKNSASIYRTNSVCLKHFCLLVT